MVTINNFEAYFVDRYSYYVISLECGSVDIYEIKFNLTLHYIM